MTQQTILIADAQPHHLARLIAALRQADFALCLAHTGPEALEKLSQCQPDLLLLAEDLPGLNGLQTTRYIRADEVYHDLPIVLLAQPGYDRPGFAVGATDYLDKPVHVPQALARLQTLLALRQTRQQLQTARKSLKRHRAKHHRALARLKAQRSRYAHLADIASDYIYSTSNDVLQAEWIPAHIHEITGYEATAFEANPRLWLSQVHPRDQHHLNGPPPPGQSRVIEYRLRTRTGQTRWIREVVIALDAARTLRAAKDITTRKQKDRENTHHMHQTQSLLKKIVALYTLSQILVTPKDVPGLLQAAADRINRAINADRSSVVVVDWERQKFIHVIRAQAEDSLLDPPPADLHFDYLWDTIVGWTIQHRKPALSLKDQPDPRESKLATQLRQEAQVGSAITAPIQYQDSLLGVVVVANHIDKPNFTPEDVDFTLALANQVGLALYNAQLLEKHRQSEQRYRAILENQTDLVSRFLPDGTLTYVNQAYVDFFGYSHAELIGRHISWFVRPDDRKPFQELWLHSRHKSQSSLKCQVVLKSGEERWTHWSITAILQEGEIEEYQAVGRDITTWYQAEQVLQLTQFFAITADLEALTGYLCQAFTELTDCQATAISLYDEDETSGQIVSFYSQARPTPSLVGFTFSRPNKPVVRGLLDSGQTTFVTDVQNNPRADHVRHLAEAHNINGIFNLPMFVNDKIIGTIHVLTKESELPFPQPLIEQLKTITRQAAATIEMLRRLEAEQRHRHDAEQQNRHLEDFAHTVAHNLRNPLGVITIQTDYIVDHLADMAPPEIMAHLKNIRVSSYKATNIIQELLVLAGARKQDVPLTTLDMTAIMAQVEQRLNLMIEQYEAEISLPATWPRARGYAPWIEEVWMNYLSNGLKYGGSPPRLELGATTLPDDRVSFWVQDNGAGLSAQDREAVFAEFTRLSPDWVEGYGLGLSIVKRIIEKLGGEVGVESDGPGQGSRFYFILSAAPPPS